jgi:hypothetical protein
MHQTRYRLNPNYAAIVKQDIDKTISNKIHSTGRSGYLVITYSGSAKEEWKIENCVDFKKLNKATKKNPYLFPLFDEVLNIITRYESYSFLDGYSRYHHISVTLEDRYNFFFD